MDRTDVIREAEQLPKKMWNPVRMLADRQKTLAHLLGEELEHLRDQ